MKRLIAILGSLLMSTPVFAQARVSGLGDDPTRFDQLLDTAFAKRDVVFIETAVADDMRFTHGVEPGGTVWDKQKFVDAVRTYSGLERNVDSVEVEQHADLIETLGHIQVKTPSQTRPEYHIYFVRLYRRGPNVWQFVSHRTVRQTDGPLSSSTAIVVPRVPGNVKTGSAVGTSKDQCVPAMGSVFRA
jgi:hypothetical protein